MASVPFEFAPPAQENIVALRIYESPDQAGPFVQIERVTNIGTYPTYISQYTTNAASSVDNWFGIAWEDEGGAISEMSDPIKVGVQTLVGEVVDRVMQRDVLLNRAVVTQEAEAVIEQYFSADPYTVEVAGVSYRILNGLVNLTLARSLLIRVFQSFSEAEQATIGLVTLKSSTSSSVRIREIDALITMAAGALGLNTSLVLQMEEIRPRATIVHLLEP